MNPTKSGIVIIGAGPAGMAASIRLSKEGIDHTVLERGTFPKDKICGDALSGKVVQHLNRLDPAWNKELEQMADKTIGSYGVRFVAPNGRELDIPFKTDLSELHSPPGYIMPRFDFDAWLAGKAKSDYANILTGATVTRMHRKGDQVEIHFDRNDNREQLTAHLVIGAEGDRSITGKSLSVHSDHLRKEKDHYCAGLRRYYQGVHGLHPKGFIELHFLPELLPGYLWIFPMSGGRANVGVGMLSSVISRKKINLRKLMDQLIHEHPALRERFCDSRPLEEIKGWGLPLGSKKRSLSGDNYLLTGDAASLIDPFTGEGIGNALVSGGIAGEIASMAVKQHRFDAQTLSVYDKEVYGQLWDELKLSRTLQQLTRQAWLFNFVVNKAARSPLLRETITGMFEDVSLRSRLSQPAFYFKLLWQ